MTALFEHVLSESLNVDAEAGVIRNVKVLGRESKNGRVYSQQAMESAARLYEGCTVAIDHDRKEPHRERGMAEGIGMLENVKVAGDGVYADMAYLKTHPLAGLVVESAQRFPKSFGLSHNADGKLRQERGKTIVEDVERVRSVDIVRNPATSGGLFESENQTMKTTFRKIIESLDPKKFETKACLLEMEGMEMADAPVEVEAEASSEDQTKAAFRAMVVAAFDDSSLGIPETLAKIKEILKSYEKLTGETSKEGPAEASTVEESHRGKKSGDPIVESLREEIRQLRKDREDDQLTTECRALLEESHREVTDVRVAALKRCENSSERKQLIEDWAEMPMNPARRPATSAPLRESIDSKPAEDGKSFAASVRS